MILLDDVVEVFDLTDLDAPLVFGIVAFDRRRAGTAVVDRDLFKRPILPDHLAQEPQRGFAIPLAVGRRSTVALALSTAQPRPAWYLHARNFHSSDETNLITHQLSVAWSTSTPCSSIISSS
jgi:hypothetical protein